MLYIYLAWFWGIVGDQSMVDSDCLFEEKGYRTGKKGKGFGRIILQMLTEVSLEKVRKWTLIFLS